MIESPSVTVETAVIGAGAAGMMAAISATERGARGVVLLEGGKRPGRKILVSGNGRCNLTNTDADNPGHYHSGQRRFPRPALAAFPLAATLAFFAHLGVVTRTEKRGRLFPLSDQAQSILDLLQDHLGQSGVQRVWGAKVVRLTPVDGAGFDLVCADGRRWRAATVIVATGGVSAPKLGADDSGMVLCERLGHHRTPLYPGLVSLVSDDPYVRRMQGVRVWSRVSAVGPGGRTVADTDDLLFTRYGLSGFTILNLSTRLVPWLAQGPRTIHISFFPGRSAEALSQELQARWRRHPHRSLTLSLAGLLHGKIVPPLLESLGLDGRATAGGLGKRDRWVLAQRLTDWPVEVSAPHSFDHAEVTIGGLRTDEVDPHTLESYLIPGLYLAGEVLDVHGDLGGFNFQWAWSSGRVAGQRRGS